MSSPVACRACAPDLSSRQTDTEWPLQVTGSSIQLKEPKSMLRTYTLEDAEQLHETGYTPVTAADIQVGDRCAYKPYNGELTHWTASRIVRETRTVEPMIGFGEYGSRTTRTFHETTVWCEYPSGACLVETFDDRTVIYIAMTLGEASE